MSTDNRASDMTTACASCGITEIDEIKLKECDGCDLVRYCSDECQEDHRTEHEKECKKRAVELFDELLFKQPDNTHRGDCPICTIPHSLHLDQSSIMTCCSKIICDGCYHANWMREEEMGLEHSCPFCRKHHPKTDEEKEKYEMKRIEANDPVALSQKGLRLCVKKGEYSRAFDYFRKAADLGDAEAHARLACLYGDGNGVEKDEEKRIHHLRIATIGGHPGARTMLGCEELASFRFERAAKHWIISAAQGNDSAINTLMEMYKKFEGQLVVSKEDLAAALRAHKAAVDATKSPDREAALQHSRILKGLQDLVVNKD